MFLKKSLLFMTALALLMFAGQASAQLSLALGEGGSTTVSGAGTEISVDVSQMGVTASVNAIQIVFDIDTDVLTLTKDENNMQNGWIVSPSGDTATLLSITPVSVPSGASFTFATAADVTGVEFSIGISSVTLDGNAIAVPLPGALAFNGLEAALTSDGEISDAGELVVNVAVPGLAQATTGAEIMFVADPAGSASISGVMPADGLQEAPMGGAMALKLTVVGLPPVTLDGGSYGSVTFAVDPDATEFSIGVASLTVFMADGTTRAVGGGEALTVIQLSPYLDASVSEPVTVLPGGSGMATVTAMDVGNLEVAFALGEGSSEGVTLAFEGATATVSASGAGTAIVTATVGPTLTPDPVSIEFVQGPLTAASDAEAALVVMPGGSASATVSASGQADGADVMYKLEEGSEGATLDGATVSASGPATAIVTAWVGDVGSNAVTISFVPSLHTESTTVTFDDFGETASASVTAVGFDEGANIRFRITGGAGFATADGAATWTVSTDKAGDVTMVAEDDMGNATAPLTISFVNPDPYLTADPEIADVIIPDGGEVVVTVTATGLGDDISWTVSEVTGTATVNISTDGATATLTGVDSDDISQTSTATLIATDGTLSTAPKTITFRKMPELAPEMANVTVPQTVVGSNSQMVVANGFPPAAEVTFNVEVVSGLESYLSQSAEGNVLTLTATGTVTVSVTASGAGVTTAAVEVTFNQDLPAAPASVVVQDNPGDNGHYVMVSFANSANHADVSQYRVYREMMVNTTMDADGNVVPTDTPMAKWVPWAVVDAMDNDDEEGMTRAVVPVTDANATRWGVAAEKGMDSAEITPAGKRVFSKESVQQLAQFLGLDPNRVVTEDELVQMFMPSADYIKSIIGDQKHVVFAALDPDLSVLIGGDLAVPQNIRTGGSGPIVSSDITGTEGMVAAVDDTAPAAVTDVTADPDTGLMTWTVSADDGGMDAVMYRGHAIVIPHLVGYKVMAGVTPDEMTIDVTQLILPETGVLPAGTSSLQVPRALIETLIDQGLPAIFVTVVAMDGTNVTGSVPLMVELAPKRKAFVDADGNPVYIVDLNDGNLTVGFEDFIAFTMAYNTSEATTTREEWRVFIQADLNDDTMVDFADFILFFGSYGKEAVGRAGKSLVTPVLGVNEAAELSLRLGSDRVVAGETMFVDVSLANVQALMGYGFVLNYDAEKFEFVEAMPVAEDLLVSSGGETPLLRGWSPEAGQVHVMNAIVNGSEVSGGGDIVRLVFRVLRDFEDDARFEIADGLVFDPQQLANPLAGGVLDIQTTPTEFALLQNFPNPFNPDTTIGYELAESADVTLQIYNVVGQVVRTLIAAEPQSVGRYQVRWDGMDDRGTPVSSGIYFYQLSAGKFQDVRKLMLLK